MEENRSALAGEMEVLFRPLEEIVNDKIKLVREQQTDLGEKMENLARDLEKVESLLPPSELDELIDKLNSFSDRIENCQTRIRNVTKRADAMLAKLAKPKNNGPKTGTLIDLSIKL